MNLRIRSPFPTAVIDTLPTPCLLVDLATVRKNIGQVDRICRERSLFLRPHFKAHKSTTLMRLQVAAERSQGVTCQTSWEACALARAGFDDILVSNQIVDPIALREIVDIALQVRVTVAVDSPHQVELLSNECARRSAELGVLIELDNGFGRCGLEIGSDLLIRLAKAIQDAPGLTFRGVQSYAGHTMLEPDRATRLHATRQCAESTRLEIARLASAGFRCEVVSGGGTGTVELLDRKSGLTEVQAGSYVLMDASYARIDSPFHIALYCVTTLISLRPTGHGVLNAGLKSLAIDHGVPAPAHEGVTVVSLSDEHARILVSHPDQFRVGDRILLAPSHVDPTVNLHDGLFVYDDVCGATYLWAVDGRRHLGAGPYPSVWSTF